VLPKDSTFLLDAGTTAQATVTLPGGQQFRDFSMIIQKAVNLRYRDGTPVENIAGEGPGVPEDAHDAGAAAINYATEPLWFRFGFQAGADWGFGDTGGGAEPEAPDPFGEEPGVLAAPSGPGLATIANAFQAYSNALTGGRDPETPVFKARPGQEVRFRVMSPVGYARNTTLTILGHNWNEEPFLSVNAPSDVMGNHPTQRFHTTLDNVVTGNGWNILTRAGGTMAAPGDYLYRDVASFGHLNGLWGVVRVEEPGTTP